MESNYTLSDIAAVTDGGMGGMGGGNWFAWILLFALFGGNGFGFGGRGGAVTEADLCNANSFTELKSSVANINDNQAAIARQTDNAICQIGYQNLQNTSALASQISECCCQTGNLIGQVRYDMAVQNGDLKAMIHSEGEATRAMIQQNKIETLQQQVSQLQLAQATCGLPRISQYAWGVYPYTCPTPTCSTI